MDIICDRMKAKRINGKRSLKNIIWLPKYREVLPLLQHGFEGMGQHNPGTLGRGALAAQAHPNPSDLCLSNGL